MVGYLSPCWEMCWSCEGEAPCLNQAWARSFLQHIITWNKYLSCLCYCPAHIPATAKLSAMTGLGLLNHCWLFTAWLPHNTHASNMAQCDSLLPYIAKQPREEHTVKQLDIISFLLKCRKLCPAPLSVFQCSLMENTAWTNCFHPTCSLSCAKVKLVGCLCGVTLHNQLPGTKHLGFFSSPCKCVPLSQVNH